MKKILGLAVAAMMVMAMVGAGTWAFFSDTETTTANILSAGTLDLSLSSATLHGSVSDAVPGDGETTPVSANTTLTNAGTVNGELDISFSSVTNLENYDSNTDEAEDDDDGDTSSNAELGGKALIAMYLDIDTSGTWSTDDIGLDATTDTTTTFATTITGTADSGTTTTLVHSALIQGDNFFNGMILEITGGTGSGQARLITGFTASSDTVTVTDAFSVALDATSQYSIANLKWDTIDNYASLTWDDVYGGIMTTSPDDFYLLYRIPTSTNNEIMGDSASFSLDFVLEQTAAD